MKPLIENIVTLIVTAILVLGLTYMGHTGVAIVSFICLLNLNLKYTVSK